MYTYTLVHVHVSFICFYFYLNAMLPHSDHQDILIEILLKVALNTINQMHFVVLVHAYYIVCVFQVIHRQCANMHVIWNIPS
jgi:hypothetical protein